MSNNQSKHTPGPWRVVDKNPLHIGGNWRGHFYDKVCTIEPRRFENVPVDTANARLIAAAPDLLAALVAVLWEYRNVDGMVPNDAPDQREEVIAARAAIAKAKGE